MNILKKMELLEHLTPTEKILVDFLQERPEDFISLKPKEVAQQSYVSLATIYRLVNKLGLKGVNELKLSLQTALREESDYQLEDIDYPILATDSHFQVMLRLKEVYEKTLADTLDLAEPDVLVKVLDKMAKAQVIDIYSSSANIYFAENFQFQMMEINSPVTVPKDDYLKRLTASTSDASHYAIVISFGGRGLSMQHICQTLKENGVPILLISSTQGNPLAQYADDLIYMASSENHYNKISSFSTRTTLLYLLDTLYSLYFQLDYDNNLAYKLASYEKLTAKDDT